jgi:hypothetical protein
MSESESLHVGMFHRQTAEEYRESIREAIEILADQYGIEYLMAKINGVSEQLARGETFAYIEIFEEEMRRWLDRRYGPSQHPFYARRVGPWNRR